MTSAADSLPPLHIIGLEIENLKRVISVKINPKSNVVRITGKNAQGKSSTLDAIWWALAGKGNISSVPIRKGQNEATIKLDLGEIVVRRTFRRDLEGETTTGVVVSARNGGRYTSPQGLLDALLGQLCMDPVAFDRMGATPEGKRQQLRQLQVFVPGYDFDGQDRLNKADFERRADVHKMRDAAWAAGELIIVPPDAPDAPIDEAALVLELETAGKTNQINERRRQNRAQARADIERLRARIVAIKPELDAKLADIQSQSDARIKALEEQIRAEREDAATRLKAAQDEADREHSAALEGADRLEAQFKSAEEIPEDTVTATIREKIAKAKTDNDAARRKAERKKLQTEHETHAAEATMLTNRMLARQAAKRAAIAAAKLPVPGLDFGDSEILLNGLPFDQASDAERLRTSCAIAIAQKPKLRVMRVREGSLLDSDGMGILEEMAVSVDPPFQLWVERVSDGQADGISFVIEEGVVKSEPEPA